MEKRSEMSSYHSVKFLRQRKFLLVLPGLIVPFLILLLWTLGLVGEVKGESVGKQQSHGLNLNLPSAAPGKDSNWNKLRYYEQAEKDSVKLRSLLKSDPYRQMELLEGNETSHGLSLNNRSRYPYNPYPAEKVPDLNEQRVYKKLAALNHELETAAAHERQAPSRKDTLKRENLLPTGDVARLESMMQSIQQGKAEDDEMKQYNDMLEKILDIQNPGRVQEKIRQRSAEHKRQVFPVLTPKKDVVSVLEPKKEFQEMLVQYKGDSMPPAMQALMESNRFYSLDEGEEVAGGERAILAVVHEDQTLVSGANIKLRLLEDIFLAGVLIPKGHFVYGPATLNAERLQVSISSIQYQGYIFPVELTVCDKKDGLPGIHIPGTITRDVAKKSASQAVQGLAALNTLDPSIGAQAASVGLQTMQSMVGKSAKLIRVKVTAGHAVLLKDDNRKE